MAPPVSQVTSQFHDLVSNEGFMGRSNHDHMEQIKNTLETLPADEVEQVMQGLDSDDLEKFVLGIQHGSIMGRQGLSEPEKKELFSLFARDLTGDQLARLTNAFATNGQTQVYANDVDYLSDAVANQNIPPNKKQAYINSLKDYTTPNGTLNGYTTSDGTKSKSALQDMLPSDRASAAAAAAKMQAGAVGKVLTSFNCNQSVFVDASLRSLTANGKDDTNLDAVVNEAGAGGTLRDMLYTVSTGTDPGQKAQVFQAAANLLDSSESVDHEQIEAGLTRILNSDPTGVLSALRQTDAGADFAAKQQGKGLSSAEKPAFSALSKYMQEMLTEDPSVSGKTLSTMINRLQLGTDQKITDPTQFDQKMGDYLAQRGADGLQDNASNLGFFAAAMAQGVKNISDKNNDQHSKVSNAISIVTGLASAASAFADPEVGAGIGVASSVLTALTNAKPDDPGPAMDAIYDLCMPDDNLMDSENQEIYKGANQVKDEWQKFFPPTPGS